MLFLVFLYFDGWIKPQIGVDTVRTYGMHFEDAINRYWFSTGIGIFIFYFSTSSVGTWNSVICWFNCLASLQKLSAFGTIFLPKDFYLKTKLFCAQVTLLVHQHHQLHLYHERSHWISTQKVCCKLQIAFESSVAYNGFWTQVWDHRTKLFLPGQFHWVGCVPCTGFQ